MRVSLAILSFAAIAGIQIPKCNAQGESDMRLVPGLHHFMAYGIRMDLVTIEQTSRSATLDLFKFSRSDNPEHSIEDKYYIPEGMVKDGVAECTTESVTSSSMLLDSWSMAKSISNSKSLGVSASVEVELSLPAEVGTVSTELSMGVAVGSESEVSDFNKETTSSLKKSTRHSMRRISYGVQWRSNRPNLGDLHESFVSAARDLDSEWSDSKADTMIENFGTHFYYAAKFGGSMSSTMFFEESATESQILHTSKEISSQSSTFFAVDETEVEANGKELEDFTFHQVINKRSAMKIVSDVDKDDFCNSEINQPVPLTYTIHPIWSLMALVGAKNDTVERLGARATRLIIHNLVLADDFIPSCTWRGCVDGRCTGIGCAHMDDDDNLITISQSNSESGIRIVNQPTFSTAGVHAVEVAHSVLGNGRVTIYPADASRTLGYVYMSTPMSQLDAQQKCEKNGGNLASVHSRAENMRLISFVDEHRRAELETTIWTVLITVKTKRYDPNGSDLSIQIQGGGTANCNDNNDECFETMRVPRNLFIGDAENCLIVKIEERDDGVFNAHDDYGTARACFGSDPIRTNKDDDEGLGTTVQIDYTPEERGGYPFWLGLKVEDNQWTWYDGTEVGYTNLRDQTTENTGVYVDVENGNTEWDSQSSTEELPFVCQYDARDAYVPTRQTTFDYSGTDGTIDRKTMYFFDNTLPSGVYDVRIYEEGAEENNVPPLTNRVFEVFEDPSLSIQTPTYGYHSLDDVLKVTYDAPFFDMGTCAFIAIVPNGATDDWEVVKQFATPNVMDAAYSTNVSSYVLLGGGQQCGGEEHQVFNNNPVEFSKIFLPVGAYEVRLYLEPSDVQVELQNGSAVNQLDSTGIVNVTELGQITLVSKKEFNVEPPTPIPSDMPLDTSELSGGETAGIAVGVVLGCASIAAAGFFFFRGKRTRSKTGGIVVSPPQRSPHDSHAQNQPVALSTHSVELSVSRSGSAIPMIRPVGGHLRSSSAAMSRSGSATPMNRPVEGHLRSSSAMQASPATPISQSVRETRPLSRKMPNVIPPRSRTPPPPATRNTPNCISNSTAGGNASLVLPPTTHNTPNAIHRPRTLPPPTRNVPKTNGAPQTGGNASLVLPPTTHNTPNAIHRPRTLPRPTRNVPKANGAPQTTHMTRPLPPGGRKVPPRSRTPPPPSAGTRRQPTYYN